MPEAIDEIAPFTGKGKFQTTLRLKFLNLRRTDRIIGIALLVGIGVFVFLPVWELISTAFTLSAQDLRAVPGGIEGAWTLHHLKRVFTGELGKKILWEPLWNTLKVGFGTTILSVSLGTIMAWFVVRTDMRFSKWINNLALMPYILPSWVNAMAWACKNLWVFTEPQFWRSFYIGNRAGAYGIGYVVYQLKTAGNQE